MPLTIVEHPLIWHRLAILRGKNTPTSAFRATMTEIALLMVPEVLSDLTTIESVIETPVDRATVKTISEPIVALPILRAGLGMVEPFIQLVPNIKISYFDINRNPDTLTPIVRRAWLPETLNGDCVIIIDPMLATGRILDVAIQMVKEKQASRVKVVSLLAAPDGVKHVLGHHPDVQLYVAAVDQSLNAHGYILPGLGDAGDRLTGFDLTFPNYPKET